MPRRDRQLLRIVQDAVHDELSMKVLLGYRISGLVADEPVITNDHPEGKRPQDLILKLLKKPGTHFVLLEINSDKFELTKFEQVFPEKSGNRISIRRKSQKFVAVDDPALTSSRKSNMRRKIRDSG